MQKILFLGFVLLVGMAQSPLPEYNLKLTNAEVEQLGMAIGLMPYKDAVPLMTKLRAQIVEQQVAAEKAKTSVEKKEEPSKEISK